MSWLRVDDGFPQHPKVVKLTRADRWTWLEVLCYCARYRTEGSVPEAISEAVKTATPAFLNRCLELRLLDVGQDGEGGYEVHGWAEYNPKDPTAADRVRRYRERNAAVTEGVTPTVTSGVTEGVTKSLRYGASRAGTRARPVPVRGEASIRGGSGSNLEETQAAAQGAAQPADLRCDFPYELDGRTIECGVECKDEAALLEHQFNVHGVVPEGDNGIGRLSPEQVLAARAKEGA